MTLYRIANWELLFETCETKKLASLKWVPTPNKHDGLSFRRVAAHANRCELFTAWNLMLQIASKARKPADRGLLQRDGKPLSPDDMAIMTGFPAKIFELALKFFSSEQIGWLVVENERPPAEAGSPPDDSGANPAEGKGREWKEGKGSAAAPAAAAESDEEWRKKLQDSEAYKALSVESEFEKAVFWCEQRRRQPTRRFFLGWLNKIERPMATNGHPAPKPSIPGWKRLEIVGEKIKSLNSEFACTRDEGHRTAIREEISSLRAEKADLESKSGGAAK